MTTKNFFIALIALSFCFTVTAQAQHVRAEPDRPAVWSQFIGQQMAQSLESPSEEIRTKALEHVIHLARSFGEELDLTEAVPALLSVYRDDPDERCRLAAVAGLHAVADEGGLQQVRLGIARQTSKRVQHAAMAVLMDFYGPETFEGAEDMAAIAESVRAYYRMERLTPPAIAAGN